MGEGDHGSDSPSVLGLGGSGMLSSATRLVLPPPPPKVFHVRSTQAPIVLTPLLEPGSDDDKAAGDICLASLPPTWVSSSSQERGSGDPHLHTSLPPPTPRPAGLQALSVLAFAVRNLSCLHLPNSSYVCLRFQVQIGPSSLEICEVWKTYNILFFF